MFRHRRRSDTPPLTPAEQFRRDAKFKLPTASQGQSPLLTLPAEIQRMILTELLGNELVHVHLRRSDEKYKREGAPTKAPGWVHCLCRRKRSAVPHCHEEKNHKWCFLSMNILRTCQSIYLQGLPILYQTNILSFRNPKDLVYFEELFVHFSLIQSIDLYYAGCRYKSSRFSSYETRRVLSCHSREYYELFLRIPSGTANIRNMRFYFEADDDGTTVFDIEIWHLLLSSVLPVAQVQIFVPGDLDKRSRERIKVEASPDKRSLISAVTHAKELLSDCYGELSDEETEQHTPDNINRTAHSSSEDDGLV